jgi:HlyD family secretion protein
MILACGIISIGKELSTSPFYPVYLPFTAGSPRLPGNGLAYVPEDTEVDNAERKDNEGPGDQASRRIVNIADVKPRSAKGKKAKTTFALLAMVAAAVALIAIFGTAGGKKTPSIKGYTVAAVEKADFVKSTEASGTVVVPAEIAVPSPQTGYANALLVAEGDVVAMGKVLATLSVPDLVASRDDLVAQLAVAKLSLAGLAKDYDYQIATQDTSTKRLDAQIATAQKDVDNKKALLALKSSRQSDYDAAVDALTALQQKREDAASQRANLVDKKALDSEKQKATMDQLQVELERANASIEEARVKAPMAGEVLSIASKLSVPGSLVNKNDTLMTIADRAGTYIDFEIGEQYVSILKIGDSLTATIGTKTVLARITAIGKVASLSSDGLTATVSVRAKPEDGSTLTPGASAVATITLGTKANDLVLPRGAYLTTGGQKYVYKVEGSVAKKTAVEFGDIQGNKVEVTKGLAAGDRIVSSGYSDFIDSDAVELK